MRSVKQKTPSIESDQEHSTTESLAGIVLNMAKAMQCPNCKSYLKQYPGGIKFCPTCETFITD